MGDLPSTMTSSDAIRPQAKNSLLGTMMPVNKHLRTDRQIHAFKKASNLHDIRNPLRDFTPA
jgi:hypothetical protein